MSTYPFCCSRRIPSSFKYINSLLPANTLHNPLTSPKSSAPFIASFLSFLTTGAAVPGPEARLSTVTTFYVLLQITTPTPLGYKKTYFAPVESPYTQTILAPRSKLLGRSWREIGEQDAVERVGLGGATRESQRWVRLEGEEKLWCEIHKGPVDIRGWVREF